ncbi:non-canonical purine NTP pyrophosphatase [Paenibacillus aurantius]|uniref:dITP/XTP pyrophosphatase n=1 Tax=Paenibacillus aurantius TaxID=2918900 RepID=A0AA96LF53_9BACL|nr:non-canonical purine NTP pyrophosphatase [Paenibacillus aurantius]WNQ12924.1 non-canonical purine NTP pyrophosphatase [Paenibacillus aurantius]
MKLNERIIVATRNAGKAKEFSRLLEPFGVAVGSLLDHPELPEVEETGTTFAENAMLKARTIAELLRIPVLADDSGLCVDALNGAPGVYSARYAGEHAADADNNAKLLKELAPFGLRPIGGGDSLPVTEDQASGQEAAPGREQPLVYSPARFVCVLAVFDPGSGGGLTVEGECRGYILPAPRGSNGFGYDPLFYIPASRQTLAEMTMEKKNAVSHRAQALHELVQVLEKRT